jgi:hypothetical protein
MLSERLLNYIMYTTDLFEGNNLPLHPLSILYIMPVFFLLWNEVVNAILKNFPYAFKKIS